MDLYLQYVHFDKQYMQYDDLVQHHLAQILGGADASSEEDAADCSSEAERNGAQQAEGW